MSGVSLRNEQRACINVESHGSPILHHLQRLLIHEFEHARGEFGHDCSCRSARIRYLIKHRNRGCCRGWQGAQTKPGHGDDSQRSFRAHDQPSKVVPGNTFDCAAT